jgi:predicted CXXCH cytochrome family protein
MRVRIIAAVVLLSVTALAVLLLLPARRTADHGPPPPPDPRLEYTGPFRNVHPSVHYVSDSRCAECHQEIAVSYAGHPMGRSLFPVDRAPAPPTGAEANNPFEAFGTRFLVEGQKGRVRHLRTRLDRAGREGAPAVEQQWEVHYVVGSGTRGYSYFTDRDGYLFQTPISWYSQKKKPWDLSPGLDATLLSGRAVVPDCLFCHANHANYVEGSLNRYTPPVFEGHAIGCQRCHGPGELHVRKDEGGGRRDEKQKKRSDSSLNPPPSSLPGDPTIVNPKYLAANLRDAVCEQCHLQGVARVLGRGRGVYDFRPGLPLESCWSVFVRSAEATPGRDASGGPAAGSPSGQQAVGQVEQMYESRCFQRSRQGLVPLGCVSCHDPHARVPPDRAAAHYRARCLQCHRDADGGGEHRRAPGCALPRADRLRRAAEDSCIACHMPRHGASDIPHTAVTDHRILRGG